MFSVYIITHAMLVFGLRLRKHRRC